jgi:hypothetical protein
MHNNNTNGERRRLNKTHITYIFIAQLSVHQNILLFLFYFIIFI